MILIGHGQACACLDSRLLFDSLQVLFLYKHYFSSMAAIAMTTLHIINGRVFPTAKYGYEVRCMQLNDLTNNW